MNKLVNIITCGLVCLVFVQCTKTEPTVIKLNHTIIELTEGDTLQLTVDPILANIHWYSENNTIATVSENGLVTAFTDGETTIVAEVNNSTATCIVLVKTDYSKVTSMPRSPKRGVSYSFALPDIDMPLLGNHISWFYNWGTAISDDLNTIAKQYEVDYFPMAWNGAFNADNIRAYKAANPNCEYILAFNEPNLTDQANMTPTQAAAEWPKLKNLATELNLKIVSPAMNYGTLANYSDPIVWLDEFFTLVPLEDIDAIAIHCYMGNASSLKSYVERFKKYGKPIWMTEFCAWENFIVNATAQMNFMSEAIQYMEQEPMVARYAWFIPRTSGAVDSYPYMQLLTKSDPFELTPLGKVFNNISSCNKAIYAKSDEIIEAEYFTSSNISDMIGQPGFSTPAHLHPTSDPNGGGLEICDFYGTKWFDYQIELTKTQTYTFILRYAARENAVLRLSVDGAQAIDLPLPSTGADTQWLTLRQELQLTEGKHTLRIEPQNGYFSINWLKIKS